MAPPKTEIVYTLFSILILPLNSIINPLLYDETFHNTVASMQTWIHDTISGILHKHLSSPHYSILFSTVLPILFQILGIQCNENFFDIDRNSIERDLGVEIYCQ